MQTRLTATKVDSLARDAAKAGKAVTVFDTQAPGMCVRITPAGGIGYYVMARTPDPERPKGRQVWARIKDGNAPVTTLAKARGLAPEGIANIKNGRPAYPGIEPQRVPDTFKQVREAFVEEYAKPRNRSWAETERILKSVGWDKRTAESITRRDVVDLLKRIAKDSGGYASNRTLSAVRKLFNWAVKQDILTANPAKGVDAIGTEVARDRVLSDAELAAFWKATGDLSAPWGDYLKVLALTGQRLREVAGMRWRDLQLDGEAPLWTIPREQTKADRVHEVPLSPAVVDVLRQVKRHKGDYVFTTGDGTTHVAAFGQLKAKVDAAMVEHLAAGEVERWTFHDLRRTMTSVAARLRIPPHVLSALLNHSPGRTFGVTAVYLRHDFADEKRDALQAWANYIAAMVEPKASNVVALTG